MSETQPDEILTLTRAELIAIIRDEMRKALVDIPMTTHFGRIIPKDDPETIP